MLRGNYFLAFISFLGDKCSSLFLWMQKKVLLHVWVLRKCDKLGYIRADMMQMFFLVLFNCVPTHPH